MEPDRITATDLNRINLRLSSTTFEAIDASCLTRPGRVSRNTWIAEAIEEKLAREAGRGAVEPLGNASNG